MQSSKRVSLPWLLTSFGLFLIFLGFAQDLVIASDNYSEANSEYEREAHFDLCVALMDDIYSVENKVCQEEVHSRVTEYMFKFIVSALEVLGIILFWCGMYGLKSSISGAIDDTEKQVSNMAKKISKQAKTFAKETSQDIDLNE